MLRCLQLGWSFLICKKVCLITWLSPSEALDFRWVKGQIAVTSSWSVDFRSSKVTLISWPVFKRALIAWFNLDPTHKCFITEHINDYPLVIKVGSWNLSSLLLGFSWSRKLTAIVLSCKNRSYPKVVPRTDFGCQKWSPRTTFGCQKWSHLAKTGPSNTNQNQSGGPLLAAESSPLEQFGLLRMVLLPYSDCWEG